MISAKELRIGNFLKDGEGAIGAVNRIVPEEEEIELVYSDGGKPFGTSTWQETEGIPLSEEWLKKMGFRVMEQWGNDGEPLKDKRYHKDPMTIQRLAFGYDVTHPRGYFCTPYYPELKGFVSYPGRIDYIHQLQNLFFILYREELIFKP